MKHASRTNLHLRTANLKEMGSGDSKSNTSQQNQQSQKEILRDFDPLHHEVKPTTPVTATKLSDSSHQTSPRKNERRRSSKDTLREDFNPTKNTHNEGKHNQHIKKASISNSSDQNVTKWSYYHEGNVRIAEICVYSIDNRCSFEDRGCQRLHAKCTSQWQMMHTSNWFNFRNFHSKEIEDAFEDVSKDGVQLSSIDPTKLHNAGREMFKILGNDEWQVDFETMVLKMKNSPDISYTIRRLSTQSAAKSKSAKATTYAWYFLDIKNEWVKYGEGDTSHNHSVSSITSEEIEKQYVTDKCTSIKFNTSQFTYTLDMEAMQQINLDTQNVRPVRRRPVKKLSTKPQKRGPINQDFPSLWDRMKSTDTMVLVTLEPSCKEYQDVMKQLLITLPTKRAVSIKRVQSQYLWRPFKNKQNELSIKYGRDDKINVQKLFHGTREEHVNDICKENFDWRLHGTNVGQLYGRGSYFSNSAAFANKYCVPNSSGHCFLLIAEVIVGEITKGDGSMTRPPKNPATNELYDTTVDNVEAPKIFVKYDKQEYYPAYVIEYK